MRTLLIDDMREFGTNGIPMPKDGDEWCHAATFDAGLFSLKFEGPWDVLYLDHDLADPDPHNTGEGIMKFLEENTLFLPKKIVLVTSNPVGRQRMNVIIKKLYNE